MLTFSVVQDIDECARLWKRFSPGTQLFGEWEYRLLFFDPAHYEPHFIVARRGGAIVGLLPLWKDLADGSFEFFGHQFTTNTFFAEEQEVVDALLDRLPPDTHLWFIENHESARAQLQAVDTSFFVDLDKYGRSLENYLATFSKKHRKNLRNDLKRLEERGYAVHRNRLEDYARMVELNVARFGEESFFFEESFTKAFERLLRFALARGELEMLSVEIGGRVAAVEAAVLDRNRYYVLIGGNDLSIPNVGKLMIIEHLQNALACGAGIVDFLTDDSGWKRLWNLSEEQLYEYVKNGE